MSYPSSSPTYPGFTSNHTLQQDQHASQHNQEQADIIALATKVGTGSSTPSNGTFLVGNTAGSSAWRPIAATDIPNTVIQEIYPVGCVYTETTGTNPNTTFGFGTWTAFGQGRVLVGNGTSDQGFAAGGIGGESAHTLATNEMPVHTHTVTDPGHTHGYATDRGGVGYAGGPNNSKDSSLGSTGSTTGSTTTGIGLGSAGSGASHNNLQPYIVVYFWQRTA